MLKTRVIGPYWSGVGWSFSLLGPVDVHMHTYADGWGSVSVRTTSLLPAPFFRMRVGLPHVGRYIDGLVALVAGL